MRRFVKWSGIGLAVVALLAGSGWAYYVWEYPYGYSHSCDKGLLIGLMAYADAHGGAFPAGEASPEASLSLSYPGLVDAEVLRGKTVSREVVQAILEAGGRLGPDTCGWHYVEGLRKGDDPHLALFWDKAGLGHFGERLSGGGHLVWFVNGDMEQIHEVQWAGFLEEQQRLLEARKKKASP